MGFETFEKKLTEPRRGIDSIPNKMHCVGKMQFDKSRMANLKVVKSTKLVFMSNTSCFNVVLLWWGVESISLTNWEYFTKKALEIRILNSSLLRLQTKVIEPNAQN